MSSLQAPDGQSRCQPADEASLAVKEARLQARLAEFESLVVAYSGGVDSAFLAVAASRALGDRLLCVTADSPSYPRRHRDLAERIAREFQLPHEFIETSEMERPEYRANPANRCYYCKTELYEHLVGRWRRRAASAAIADGSNADDRGDYRPGRQAAREFGVKSPLDDAESDQSRDSRAVAPRGAAHLGRAGVRVPLVPHPVSKRSHRGEALDDRAAPKSGPPPRLPRVPRAAPRHGRATRDWPRRDGPALDPAISAALVSDLKAIGYQYVCLDLQGYRTGSLNEILTLRPV